MDDQKPMDDQPMNTGDNMDAAAEADPNAPKKDENEGEMDMDKAA